MASKINMIAAFAFAITIVACSKQEPEQVKQVVAAQQAAPTPTAPETPDGARWAMKEFVPGYNTATWYSDTEPRIVDGFVIFKDIEDNKVVKLPAALTNIFEL